MTPAETALVANILFASGIVFAIALVGNVLTFSNRFVNALVTALVFAVFYGGLAFTVDRTVLPEEFKEASRETWAQMILMAAVLVFLLDLIANFLSFSNRFVSALVTAILFAVLFGFAIYATGGVPPAATTPVPSAVPAPAAAPATP
ncbi:MAG: hypothetical protein ACM3L9_07670 [Deltaproteobacteria bacterium]